MGEHFDAPALDPSLMNHAMPFFVAVGMQRGSERHIRLAADPAHSRMCRHVLRVGKEKQEGSPPLLCGRHQRSG